MKHGFAWVLVMVAGCLAGCQGQGAGPGDGTVAQAVVQAPVAATQGVVQVTSQGTTVKVTAPPTRQERLDLLARANALMALKTDGPAKEWINRLRTEPNPSFAKVIQDVDKEIPANELWNYVNYKEYVELAESGLDWPVPARVVVPRVPMGEKVVLDGDLTDRAWAKALTWTQSYKFNERKSDPDVKTTWKMLWDADYLYLGFACVDEDVVSQPRKRDEKVYKDDCVELCISPDARFRGYWEIVINADNEVFDAIHVKKNLEWGMDTDVAQNVEGMVSRIKREGPEGKPGYCAEVAVPWSCVIALAGKRPGIGDTFRFMLVRVQATTGKKLEKGYAPVPVLAWGHNWWNLMTMELGE
jgi:hypothetical protein